MARRVIVRTGDTLLFGGLEIGVDVLAAVVNPKARLLWAFMQKDGAIQPVAYDESKVIWLEETDMKHADIY